MERVAISKVCPSCGAGEYRKLRSRRWIAFSDDRVCLSCGTRYSPPTTVWAAFVLALGGAIVFVTGVVFLVVDLVALLRGRVVAIGLAISIGLMALGVAAGAHRVRALLFPRLGVSAPGPTGRAIDANSEAARRF
jgi:hypothetical protein